jgi:hypothetical protein
MPHIPCITLYLHEIDAEKVLVYSKNGRDDNRNGEVLFDERVIEAQVLLDIETIVVPSRRANRHHTNAQEFGVMTAYL